jgi:hypothetical protein
MGGTYKIGVCMSVELMHSACNHDGGNKSYVLQRPMLRDLAENMWIRHARAEVDLWTTAVFETKAKMKSHDYVVFLVDHPTEKHRTGPAEHGLGVVRKNRCFAARPPTKHAPNEQSKKWQHFNNHVWCVWVPDVQADPCASIGYDPLPPSPWVHLCQVFISSRQKTP